MVSDPGFRDSQAQLVSVIASNSKAIYFAVPRQVPDFSVVLRQLLKFPIVTHARLWSASSLSCLRNDKGSKAGRSPELGALIAGHGSIRGMDVETLSDQRMRRSPDEMLRNYGSSRRL
jgi:hypothetical protein